MGLSACSADAAEYVSPADYLRLERQAAFKHEYFQGEIRAMAGPASPITAFAPTLPGSCTGNCVANSAQRWAATSACKY